MDIGFAFKLIADVGFPIAAACAGGYFVFLLVSNSFNMKLGVNPAKAPPFAKNLA